MTSLTLIATISTAECCHNRCKADDAPNQRSMPVTKNMAASVTREMHFPKLPFPIAAHLIRGHEHVRPRGCVPCHLIQIAPAGAPLDFSWPHLSTARAPFSNHSFCITQSSSIRRYASLNFSSCTYLLLEFTSFCSDIFQAPLLTTISSSCFWISLTFGVVKTSGVVLEVGVAPETAVCKAQRFVFGFCNLETRHDLPR